MSTSTKVANNYYYSILICFCFEPVSWGCRIYQLHLCRGVRPPPKECPGYDTKQSDGEVPVLLWEMWSNLNYHYSHVHSDLV